jgi:CDP-diacylglycerol--serine O-phosphatidyltransferase
MAPGGNRYFVGLPTPAAAGVIAATVHFFHGRPIEDVRASFAWLGLLVVLGVLMSSTLRFFSFKDIPLKRRQPSPAVILFALLLGAVVYFSHATLLLITAAYMLHGPVMQLVRTVRHRLASRPA